MEGLQSSLELGMGSTHTGMVGMEKADPDCIVNCTEDSVYPANTHFSWILSPMVVIVFVISIVGSISIFVIVCFSKTYRRTSNYLVANLCVASVYHIVVSILYNLQSGGANLWEYGPITCQILAVVHRMSTPVLPLTITGISLDRSVVARNPLDYPSRKTAIARVIFIWIFSLALLIPRACMSLYDQDVHGGLKCKKVLLWNSIFLHASYAVLTVFVIYIIPTYVLVKESFAMWCQIRFLRIRQVEQRRRFDRRVRVMTNACIFTCIFITCWLPQGILQFLFDLPEEQFFPNEFLHTIVGVRDFFRQLSIFNTCLTPIILLVLSFDIQEFVSSYNV